jgi:hypothetical protein
VSEGLLLNANWATATSWPEQAKDDHDDIRFVLVYQHAKLYFYSVSIERGVKQHNPTPTPRSVKEV